MLKFPLGLASAMLCSCNFMSSAGHRDMANTTAPIIKVGDFKSPLHFPRTLDLGSAQLKAQITSPGTLSYDSNGLGPTLVAWQGSTVHLQLQNHLDQPTNLHWHGLSVPADQDGLPEDLIQPGSSKDYSFPLSARAGLYWYHPHVMGSTGLQVYQGLAGLILVRDSTELQYGLPSGEFELPLVLQDRKSQGGYQLSAADSMNGMMGDLMLVNGIRSPVHLAKKGLYRLRILNGSNARIYNLARSDGKALQIIGSDGGLLSAPVLQTSQLLGPGERTDLILDLNSFGTGQTLDLVSLPFDLAKGQGQQKFSILRFKILDSTAPKQNLATSFEPLGSLAQGDTTRTFLLSYATEMDSTNPMSMMAHHTINGLLYDPMRMDAVVQPGAMEYWEFSNLTEEPHPVHLHGVQFRILERTGGRPLAPSEMGWKDTFVLLHHEKAKIAVRFGSELGRYLFHCHNLEHEEAGMMLQYQIKP